MKWSLRLGFVFGIAVYIHWTFVLLIGWILFASLSRGQSIDGALKGVVFILALFGCVVLHELGHALTARRFGIKTRDITLLPIGGVARLERMPEEPMREFWVAIAGPAVNVVIAAVLVPIIAAVYGFTALTEVELVEGNFLIRLMWVNLFLVVFNLLPAFPMDGGRVLRALLAQRMGRRRATDIAASIGQIMAILFGIIGFFFNPFLIFIAIFVYLGAQAEAQMVGMQVALKGMTVQDAMLNRYRTLSTDDSLEKAVQELLAGSQQDFPVLQNGHVAGLLRRNDLVQGLAQRGRDARVGDAMKADCKAVQPGEKLEKAFEALRQGECATLPVMQDGELVGILTFENLAELMMINTALEQHSGRGAR